MDNTTFDLVFPAVGGIEVVSRNDGGDITSDAGLLLVSLADKKLGLTQAISDAILDSRDQDKVVHGVIEMARERIYAICADYEDANDLDTLRYDPALKTACKRLPKTGEALASQPTISRFENMPGAKDQVRMAVAIAHRVISALPAQTRRVIIDPRPDRGPMSWPATLRVLQRSLRMSLLSAGAHSHNRRRWSAEDYRIGASAWQRWADKGVIRRAEDSDTAGARTSSTGADNHSSRQRVRSVRRSGLL